MYTIRLHGDNIVECERIVDLIVSRLLPDRIARGFVSLACPFVEIENIVDGVNQKIRFEMFPGFNKNTSDRWKTNILHLLKQNGSFLDETPDVIITKVVDKDEVILAAIEFCSALQAGNQAWQRSGRAYSTGRTKVPYIYIVDFVKYELDTRNRLRKSLRFPNPAVPYSYISYSKLTSNIIIQAYFRAEEFQPNFDAKIRKFDETIFSENEVADFIIFKIFDKNTEVIESKLLEKNLRMVKFLSKATKDTTNFTSKEWEDQYNSGKDIVEFSKKIGRFNFSKKIADKSKTGLIDEFSTLVKKYSKGFASSDLPFGIISKDDRSAFVKEIHSLYKINNEKMIEDYSGEKDLVVCMLKGFKPRGDDNRPDRGALPLIAMLAGEDTEIMTFIYGPIVKSNLNYIDSDLNELAKRNGLWKTFVGLSDFIIIDSPVIGESNNIIRVIDNRSAKQSHLKRYPGFEKMYIDSTPNQYQENDVDTVIHSLFKHVLPQCFEGMCNPPGGDWSGMSLISGDFEYRWLSLPRVSSDGKRPDHVLQLFNVLDNDVLLTIESKEKPNSLESKIGIQLKKYIEYLMGYTSSVYRSLDDKVWKIGTEKVNYNNYTVLSVGAFIINDNFNNQDFDRVFKSSHCDLLIGIKPSENNDKWIVELKGNNENAVKVIDYIQNNVKNSRSNFDASVFILK